MKPSIFIAVILFCVSCATPKSQKLNFAANPVIAHRGAFKKNAFPENSIASLEEAIRLKCAGSEFDVRMSSDDTLLINHDLHYAGLDIEKTSYHELARSKLSNGEVLPTLRNYLLAGLKNNSTTQLVVEIKPSPNKQRGKFMAAKVLDLVKELGAEHMVAYISFDYDIVKKLEELDSTVITQYLNGDVSPEKLKADGIDGADYNLSVFRNHPEWISQAKAAGILLNVWTVNEEVDMRWLLSKGFDFITTNEPELLLSIVKKN